MSQTITRENKLLIAAIAATAVTVFAALYLTEPTRGSVPPAKATSVSPQP